MIVDLPSTTTVAISKKLVALRQDTGAMALGRVLTLLIVVDEKDADFTVTTCHKAKGREWDHVVIGDDFPQPVPGKEPRREELRLAYVAVTRGKRVVELGSLAYGRQGVL